MLAKMLPSRYREEVVRTWSFLNRGVFIGEVVNDVPFRWGLAFDV